MGIDHVKFYVKDLDIVTKFYVEILGFQKELVNMEEKYVVLKNGDIGIDLQVPKNVQELAHPGSHSLGFTHMAFRVADVHATYQELSEKGLEFFIKPRFNPVNNRTLAFFRDPEGNVLHLTD